MSLSNVTLSGLLPQTEFYLTYEGSLTWPACFETVTWILMNKPIYITVRQVRSSPAPLRGWGWVGKGGAV